MHIVFELFNNSSKSVQIIAKPYIENMLNNIFNFFYLSTSKKFL